MTARLVVIAVFACAAVAQAKPARPQHHETQIDLAVLVGNQANGSTIGVTYFYTPDGIDRNHKVVPQLRRFVLRPSYFWASAVRAGSTIEVLLQADVGGKLYLLDKRLAASLQAGFLLDSTRYDPAEDGFGGLPMAITLGGRPTALLELLAYYRATPVLFATQGGPVTERRSGVEQEIGGVVEMVTPGERLSLKLTGGYYRADWDFSGINVGPVTVRGPRVRLRSSVQISRSTSFVVEVLGRTEVWKRDRLALEDKLRVNALSVNMDVVFWFRGKLSFRVGLGGGYESESLLFPEARGVTGFGLLHLGVTSRY